MIVLTLRIIYFKFTSVGWWLRVVGWMMLCCLWRDWNGCGAMSTTILHRKTINNEQSLCKTPSTTALRVKDNRGWMERVNKKNEHVRKVVQWRISQLNDEKLIIFSIFHPTLSLIRRNGDEDGEWASVSSSFFRSIYYHLPVRWTGM